MRHVSAFLKLVIAILVCELAGAVGAAFTASAIPTWYAALAKPALNPPAWVFAPVWTTLYALMGLALFIIWRRGLGEPRVAHAIGMFSLQLVLNAAWSPIFFGAHAIGWALADLIVLALAVLWTMVRFYRISKKAMWLLVTYFLWIMFAGYLNYAIWTLNA